MSQIRRLSKEVKDEVHDIKRIKGEVTHMKVRLLHSLFIQTLSKLKS